MSVSGVSSSDRLMDVGLHQSVERGGEFRIRGGHDLFRG
jgi:hypothetical protein